MVIKIKKLIGIDGSMEIITHWSWDTELKRSGTTALDRCFNFDPSEAQEVVKLERLMATISLSSYYLFAYLYNFFFFFFFLNNLQARGLSCGGGGGGGSICSS